MSYTKMTALVETGISVSSLFVLQNIEIKSLEMIVNGHLTDITQGLLELLRSALVDGSVA